jgi:hypothetical protein
VIEDLKYDIEDVQTVIDILGERRGGTQWTWAVDIYDFGNGLRVALGLHIEGVLYRNAFPLPKDEAEVAELAKTFSTKREWLPVFAELAGSRLQTWADWRMGHPAQPPVVTGNL